jgi:hypothetical protein
MLYGGNQTYKTGAVESSARTENYHVTIVFLLPAA